MTDKITLLVDFMNGDQLQSSMSFTGRKVMSIGKTITESLIKERQKNPGTTAKVSRVTWSDGSTISEAKMDKVNEVVNLLMKTSGLLTEEGEEEQQEAPPKEEKVPTFKIGFADDSKLLATKVIKAKSIEELSKNINRFFGIAKSKFPEAKNLRHVMLRADLPDGTSLNSTEDGRVMGDITKIMQALVKPTSTAAPEVKAGPADDAPAPEEKPKEEPPKDEKPAPEEPAADAEKPAADEPKPEEKPKEAPPAKVEPKPAPEPEKKPAEEKPEAEPKPEEKPKEEPKPEDDKEVEEAAPLVADVAKQVGESFEIIKGEMVKIEGAVIASLRKNPSKPLADWYNKGVKKTFGSLQNELLFNLHLISESALIPLKEDEEETKDIWDIAVDNGFVPQRSGQDLKARLTKPGTRYEVWLTYESPFDILYKNWEIREGTNVIATGMSADEFEHKLKELLNCVKGKLKESRRRRKAVI